MCVSLCVVDVMWGFLYALPKRGCVCVCDGWGEKGFPCLVCDGNRFVYVYINELWKGVRCMSVGECLRMCACQVFLHHYILTLCMCVTKETLACIMHVKL